MNKIITAGLLGLVISGTAVMAHATEPTSSETCTVSITCSKPATPRPTTTACLTCEKPATMRPSNAPVEPARAAVPTRTASASQASVAPRRTSAAPKVRATTARKQTVAPQPTAPVKKESIGGLSKTGV